MIKQFMHPPQHYLLLTSLVFTLFLLSACNDQPTPDGQPEIRIGLLTPIDATNVMSSTPLNAAQLAVDEINENGGLLVNGQRHRITLIAEDDGGTAETAVQTALRLINQENIVALVGPPFSSTALFVAPLANEARIPLITPTATNPEITPGRPYVFRATFDDNFQGIALANFIQSNLGYSRVAILYDITNNYSRGLAETFNNAFTSYGGEVVAIETYTADTADTFTKQLQRIAAAQPQAIFIPNSTNDVLIQGAEIRNMGLEATLIGGDSWQGQRLSEQGQFVGSFFSGNYCRDLTNDTIRRFVEAYEDRFGIVPDGLAALTYDSFGLLFATIQAQNSFEADMIRDGLYSILYEGVTGPIMFDADGNPMNKNVAIWMIGETERSCYTVISPAE
jgi:branched-chain amino acid transport system substrate-binding protein